MVLILGHMSSGRRVPFECKGKMMEIRYEIKKIIFQDVLSAWVLCKNRGL